jgi:hypothetical protein
MGGIMTTQNVFEIAKSLITPENWWHGEVSNDDENCGTGGECIWTAFSHARLELKEGAHYDEQLAILMQAVSKVSGKAITVVDQIYEWNDEQTDISRVWFALDVAAGLQLESQDAGACDA